MQTVSQSQSRLPLSNHSSILITPVSLTEWQKIINIYLLTAALRLTVQLPDQVRSNFRAIDLSGGLIFGIIGFINGVSNELSETTSRSVRHTGRRASFPHSYYIVISQFPIS